MLSRPQFDSACKAFIEKYAESTENSITTKPFRGWIWNEHPKYPNFGYMSRTVSVFRRHVLVPDPEELLDQPLVEESDPSVALAKQGSLEPLVCQQYVVFSATFRVPAFYFTICTSNGSPLPLSDVVKTSMFKSNACDGVEVSSFALSLPTSSFPLLSHGDHPTLGTPCWYFHPCETSVVVEELLHEARESDWDEEAKLIRWLELWFMVVCSITNM